MTFGLLYVFFKCHVEGILSSHVFFSSSSAPSASANLPLELEAASEE